MTDEEERRREIKGIRGKPLNVFFDVDNTLVDGWSGKALASYVMRRRPFHVATLRSILDRGLAFVRSGLEMPAAVETGTRSHA